MWVRRARLPAKAGVPLRPERRLLAGTFAPTSNHTRSGTAQEPFLTKTARMCLGLTRFSKNQLV